MTKKSNAYTWGLGIATNMSRLETIRYVKSELKRLRKEVDFKRQYNDIYYMLKYGENYRYFIDF